LRSTFPNRRSALAPDPGYSLTFTAEELERFIEILIEIRAHLQPPVSRA
jgi:hypothetical protein